MDLPTCVAGVAPFDRDEDHSRERYTCGGQTAWTASRSFSGRNGQPFIFQIGTTNNKFALLRVADKNSVGVDDLGLLICGINGAHERAANHHTF